MPASALSIDQIKDAILKRARERQAGIERGAYEVPLHYTPLPLPELLDFLSQWEYRRDSLRLAVPPPGPGLAARLSRFCKSLVSNSLRWLLIRQVEFNTAAIRHAQALAEFLAAVDKNQAEFLATLANLKVQVHALANRLAEIEKTPTSPGQIADDASPRSHDDERNLRMYQIYLEILTARNSRAPATHTEKVSKVRVPSPILVLGSGRGDFLRFLVSEGVSAQGVEPDAEWVEFCRERELPAIRAEFMEYLDGLADGSVAGIVLKDPGCRMPAGHLAEVLGRCWAKLRKGAVLIAEVENPQASAARYSSALRLPVELMAFLLESRCFTVVDTVFGDPAPATTADIMRTSEDRIFDLRRFGRYAVVGRR